MSLENAVGLVLAIVVLGYLIYALVYSGAARMSSYAWLQLGVLAAILLVTTPCPRRVHRRGLRRRQGARRPRVPPGRAARLPHLRRRPEREQTWPVVRRSRCSRSASSPCSASTCCSGSRATCRSTRPTRRRAAGARVQHRGQLRHQHELAELRRRVDDEPPHADGRPRRCRTSSRPRSASPSRWR